MNGSSAWDEIPSGTTVKGSISYQALQPAGIGGTVLHQISLSGVASVPLADADVHVINTGQIPTDGDPGQCTGSPANPTAPGGLVCIYISEPTGDVLAVEGMKTTFLPDHAFALSIDVGTDGGSTAVFGAWAYTAPGGSV